MRLSNLFYVGLCALAPACNQTAVPSGAASLASPDAGNLETADAAPEPVEGVSFGGGQGPHFESVNRDYDAILAASVRTAEFFCACEVTDPTGPEFTECVDSYIGTPPPPVLYCSKEVYSQSEAAALAIGCERALVDTYVRCIQQSTCLDFDHIFDCETERILADLECEDIPYVVWAEEQEKCLGRPMEDPFECSNGELINPSWVCDLEADCEDGSDETGCNPHAGLTGGP